ncbi:unnamed protein product [Heligmosomoides polygyrus]|uniref:Uncharacterized protein n=1 Tax=Heligmosomoides polygyrus TaxID=6339 RepID=A0A183G624_HELPZ|nr:unnamed protein product [Heligmosomoides polygyrus]
MPGSCVVTDAKNLRYLPGTFVWILLYHISQFVLINITMPPSTFLFFQALISIPELLIPTSASSVPRAEMPLSRAKMYVGTTPHTSRQLRIQVIRRVLWAD